MAKPRIPVRRRKRFGPTSGRATLECKCSRVTFKGQQGTSALGLMCRCEIDRFGQKTKKVNYHYVTIKEEQTDRDVVQRGYEEAYGRLAF